MEDRERKGRRKGGRGWEGGYLVVSSVMRCVRERRVVVGHAAAAPQVYPSSQDVVFLLVSPDST